MNKDIEKFAKQIVLQLRDASIQACDLELNPKSQSPVAKRWRAFIKKKESATAVYEAIPDCVDAVICALFRAFDEGTLPLLFRADNGEIIDLGDAGLGELVGYYMMTEGWRERYSKERFKDYFSDLS